MSNFTVEEINLMCVFNTDNRNKMINDIQNVIPQLEDNDMEELAERVLRKLEKMSDEEFAEIVLEPIEEESGLPDVSSVNIVF